MSVCLFLVQHGHIVSLLLQHRYDNQDNHHPHDLQAQRYCCTEDDRKGTHHSGSSGEECGHHLVECWGT